MHSRSLMRLKGYDYTLAGAYFVTLVTWNRQHLFGEIIDGEMKLNTAGEIVARAWTKSTIIRPNVNVDVFVIMPNHIHGIIIIDEPVRGDALIRPDNKRTGIQSGSLGAIIGQMKSVTTKQINIQRGLPGAPVWQRNYYDHIIRDAEEIESIYMYIIQNPVSWSDDPENPPET